MILGLTKAIDHHPKGLIVVTQATVVPTQVVATLVVVTLKVTLRVNTHRATPLDTPITTLIKRKRCSLMRSKLKIIRDLFKTQTKVGYSTLRRLAKDKKDFQSQLKRTTMHYSLN